MKRLLATVGVLLALVAVVGVYYLLRETNRIVNLGCGEIPAHTSGFGYLNSRLYPLGTILVKDGSPGGIAVLGYAAGRNPDGMPGAGGRDRKLALKAEVQGAIPWANAETRSGIEQAASRLASFTAHNARGWSLPGMEDKINRAEIRRQIEQHLRQRHAVAVITSVLITDGLSITTTTGEDASAVVSLGTFGRNSVAAKFSCGSTDQFKGKNIPIAFDVTEIEDPGPQSPLRTRPATPGAWGVRP